MPDGSAFSRHSYGADHANPTMTRCWPDGPQHVTSEMQEAGAKALAERYTGVAFGKSDKPVVLGSASAFGIAASHAYLAMERVNQRGERDYLQHPGLLGDQDPVLWKAMFPEQRATHMQEQAGDHLLGLAQIAHRLRVGNPGLDAMAAMLGNNLVALAQELQRAAAVRRRVPAERREAQRIKQQADQSFQEEHRRRENEARADRRRRAKERAAAEVAA